MKFCPFLVAGQSLAPQQQVGASMSTAGPTDAPDVDTILQGDSVQPTDLGEETTAQRAADPSGTGTSGPSGDDVVDAGGDSTADAGGDSLATAPDPDSQELQIVRFRTIRGSGSGATTLPAHTPQLSALECLGEPCRFFHAGGCRFDALFESQVRSSSAHGGAVRGTIVDVPEDSVVESEDTESSDQTLAARSVLEEVWSLQRESLREVMGGFQKLEVGREKLESGITEQFDSQATRVHDTLGKVGARVGGVAEQVDQVVTQVGKVHSQVSDAVTHLVQVAASVGQVGSAVGKVETRFGEVGSQVSTIVTRVSDVGTQVTGVETRVAEVGTQVSQVDVHLGELGSRISGVDARVAESQSRVEHATSVVGEVGAAVDRVGSQVDQVGSQVEQVGTQVVQVDGRIGAVENRAGRIEGRVNGSGHRSQPSDRN